MMRNGQNKRMRGRNRNNSGGGGHHHHNRGHHHNPLTRVYESNGPDVKIRGTAHHVAEKYLQLARDAASSGDHVTAEAHHQHAEHYLRLIAAAQEQFRQQNPHYQPQAAPTEPGAEGIAEDGSNDAGQGGQQPQQNFGNPQPNYQPQQQQPQQQPYGGQQSYGGQPQFSRPQHQQHQPQYHPQQNQPPHQPQQNQPQQGGNDVGGLPSFITGGQPQAPQYGGGNGHDGQGDRFHRRRRRHRGPHHQGGGQGPDVRNDGPDDSRPE